MPKTTLAELGVDDSRCFFILGAPRSGTTVLRLLLNQHSELCVPPETWFFPLRFEKVRKYGDFSQLEQREEFSWDVAATLSESQHPVSYVFQMTPDQVVQAITERKADTYVKAYAAFMEHVARRDGKARWGDKTPYHTAFIETLATCFPRAKLIAIVRDPRDVVASIQNTTWGRLWYPHIFAASKRWALAIEGIEEARRHLGPDRLLCLRYEDFVQDPEAGARQMCELLEVEYEPAMLNYFEKGIDKVPEGARSWHQKISQPISASNVGNWRRRYNASQVSLIETVCGKLMKRWGYAPEGGHHWMNLAKLGIWNAKSWLRQDMARLRYVKPRPWHTEASRIS